MTQNPYLAGNFGPVSEEVTAFDLEVTGTGRSRSVSGSRPAQTSIMNFIGLLLRRVPSSYTPPTIGAHADPTSAHDGS